MSNWVLISKKKKNRGTFSSSYHHFSDFQANFFQHSVADIERIKLPFALKKVHILADQKDIYSTSYSIL